MASVTDVAEKLSALRGTVGDVVRRRGDPVFKETLRKSLEITPTALWHTLPWLVRAREGHDESLIGVALANAKRRPGGLAFEMGTEQLTWADVDLETSKLAHVLSGLGVRAGSVVVLLGENSPFYLVATLAASRVGATASLINHHLEGAPLAHALSSSGARVGLVQAKHAGAVRALDRAPLDHVLVYDEGDLEERLAKAPRRAFPRVRVDAGSDFVYIFTSGTTGLPKPCRVSHARSVVAGAAFGPLLFGFEQGDKLYSVLPLYHSSAMLIGAGSCIMTRTPMALRSSFSAKAFWPDVQRYGATAILYIGELCRYLVNSEKCEEELNNPVRVAVGNGLRADVWEEFARRFDIPQIREFYSATEAPGAIFNLTGKVGSIGHVPMRRLGSLKLARFDVESEELVRDETGFCVECGPEEVGELLIKLKDKPASALGDFRGYTDEAATKKKILENVFKAGDRYFRSGDLMRFDDNDYFYFVDRIGDTYRWKGENVSTAEVAEVVGKAPGVRGATVTGVRVPGNEGQAGLAALECEGDFDAAGFWRTAQGLPGYAQPRFVRILPKLATTGTFKIQKTELRNAGVDPEAVRDPLWVRTDGGYVELTSARWREIAEGTLRL